MFDDFLDWLLDLCSSLRNGNPTPLTSSENLTRPMLEVGESLEDMRLPFYTSGFE